jgi:hypothetical protein
MFSYLHSGHSLDNLTICTSATTYPATRPSRNTKLTPVQYTTQYFTFSLSPLKQYYTHIFFSDSPFSAICIYVLLSTVILAMLLCVRIDI